MATVSFDPTDKQDRIFARSMLAPYDADDTPILTPTALIKALRGTKSAALLITEAELSEQGFYSMNDLAEAVPVTVDQAIAMRAALGNTRVLREHPQRLGALYEVSKQGWRMHAPIRAAVRKHLA